MDGLALGVMFVFDGVVGNSLAHARSIDMC